MNSSNGVTNTFSEAGGNNVFKNTPLSSSAEGLVTVTEKEKEITLNNPKNFTLENLKINGINYQKEIPTVNNPQEIKTVTENMIIKSVGKNLLDESSPDSISTANYVYFDNKLKISGNAWNFVTWFFPVEKGETYSFSYKERTNSGLYLYIREMPSITNDTSSIIRNIIGSGEDTKYTFMVENDCYLQVRFSINAQLNDVEIENIQLEKGSHVTDFEMYKESNLSYDLEDNFMTEIDYIENGVLHKKTRHLSLAIKDMDNDEDYPGWTNMTQLKEDYQGHNGYLSAKCAFISNMSNDPRAFSINTTGVSNKKLFLPRSIWGLTQSEWKEQYPDLVLDLYYEAPETLEIPLESVGKLDINGNEIITNNFNSLMEIKYTKENDGYEFWNGSVIKNSNDNSNSFSSMLLQKGTLSQEQDVTNGNYSVSFYYQKLNEFANASVVINDREYLLDSTEIKQFYTGEQDPETGEYVVQPVEVTSKHIKIEFKCDIPNSVEVWDLMCNKGTVKLAWSQNQNEVTTDTVNISKGITITSTNIEAIFKANANGIRILTLQGVTVAYFTDKGLSTKELIVENKAQICGTLVQEVDSQTWFTRM